MRKNSKNDTFPQAQRRFQIEISKITNHQKKFSEQNFGRLSPKLEKMLEAGEEFLGQAYIKDINSRHRLGNYSEALPLSDQVAILHNSELTVSLGTTPEKTRGLYITFQEGYSRHVGTIRKGARAIADFIERVPSVVSHLVNAKLLMQKVKPQDLKRFRTLRSVSQELVRLEGLISKASRQLTETTQKYLIAPGKKTKEAKDAAYTSLSRLKRRYKQLDALKELFLNFNDPNIKTSSLG